MTPAGTEESGITPETRKNPQRLHAVEPAKAKSAPRTPERPPNNLPLELSSFVGREKELAEVERLLEHNRLLTLTGSGGCGKTRLALAAATDLVEGFEDGVWLVELAPPLPRRYCVSVQSCGSWPPAGRLWASRARLPGPFPLSTFPTSGVCRT